jgi:RimJ/RimL family protein N-acetyltransferase
MPLLRGEWLSSDALTALEPTPRELGAHAAALAAAYNDPHNRAMMANTTDFSEADVVVHYAQMAVEGARSFLLFRDGALAGDADLRNLARGTGELAILVASREAQGKGLGTRLAIVLHALAFRLLALERVYVTILPENAASRRLFEKLGYAIDDGPEARALVDDQRDVSMSVTRTDFERTFATELAQIRVAER